MFKTMNLCTQSGSYEAICDGESHGKENIKAESRFPYCPTRELRRADDGAALAIHHCTTWRMVKPF